MVNPSSDSLHPSSGARFALTRIGTEQPDAAQGALAYEVQVYVSGGVTLQGLLSFSESGAAQLQGLDQAHWAFQETLKLARVVKKSQVGSLLRWRPGPG